MSSPEVREGDRLRAALVYGLMIATTVIIYLVIREYGERLAAPAPSLGSEPFGLRIARTQVDEMLHVLLALTVVIIAARVVGSLFRVFHQPPVVGEILAGIMLGPSLLGRFAPDVYAYVLPASVAPFLNVIAQVGVILYMFMVGLELDPALLRKRGHAAVAVSHASIIAPFILGAAFALFIYPQLSSRDVPFTCFSLFLGVSMSVTAFPVLARILTDRRIHRTRMGAIALTCAAVDDVTAWCLLAFVVGVVESRSSSALVTGALAMAYIAAMILIVRPAMARLSLVYGNRGRLTQGVLAVVFVALLLSAFATDLIGIHPVFGAFALGAVIPHDSGMAREITDRLEDLVVVLLLPAFFAFTGLRTQIGLVNGIGQWMLVAAIIAIASVGKFGGSAVAARLTGLGWRDAAALGVLMNTRGLMELIVLNIGLDLKVISPELFAMLVLMALVTTFATTPILHLITRGDPLEEETAAPLPTLVGAQHRRGILVPIANPEGVPALLNLAWAATRPDDPAPRVLALVRPPAGGIRSGLRELERRVVPQPRALAVALEHASARKAHIAPETIWSDDPGRDIMAAAGDSQIGWVLLGLHRPVFGTDFRGGVVRDVLNKARETPLNVGILVYGAELPLERVFAVVDAGPHGRASLELAARIAERRQCTLHAVMVPEAGMEPDEKLLQIVKDAARRAGRWLHTDVLAERTAAQMSLQTPGPLVIIGTNLIDELGLPLDGIQGAEPHIVVVQSAKIEPGAAVLPGAADRAATS